MEQQTSTTRPGTQHPSERRTQEERRTETRTRLLEAAIECLVDVGYAATTTRRVAEVAGVSQGAQTHHFPHRVDLVGAAVEHLAERRIADLRERLRTLAPSGPERMTALLDLLWADFSSQIFTVFVKLWVAAADDPDLHERLVGVERRLSRAIAQTAAELGGDLTSEPGWESRLNLVLTAMRGLALSESFEPRTGRRRAPWPKMRAALLTAFVAEADSAGRG